MYSTALPSGILGIIQQALYQMLLPPENYNLEWEYYKSMMLVGLGTELSGSIDDQSYQWIHGPNICVPQQDIG
jgi:hypothetical protein